MKKIFFFILLNISLALFAKDDPYPVDIPFIIGASCKNDQGSDEDWMVELDETIKIVKYIKTFDFVHPRQKWWFVPTMPGVFNITFKQSNRVEVFTIKVRRYSLWAMPYLPSPWVEIYF